MTNKLASIYTALALLFPAALFAQDSAFSYQGHLKSGGAPANGLYEITFSLHDAATNGNTLGTPVTLAPVPVTNGLFTATLDFGTAAFNGANRWLELSVTVFNSDQPVVTLTPRQPITAAPHALYAANAASALTLGGFGPRSFWRLDGNAGTTAGTHFLGTTDNERLELRVNQQLGLTMFPNRSSVPSIIGGAPTLNLLEEFDRVRGCFVGGGSEHHFQLGSALVSDPEHSVILGGQSHSIGGRWNSIGGGYDNLISSSSQASVVGGGQQNEMTGSAYYGVIGGGRENALAGRATDYTTIGGGQKNRISGGGALGSIGGTIAGGIENAIVSGTDDIASTISGGFRNQIFSRSESASIGGGANNLVNAGFAGIGGGSGNQIQIDAPYATIPGGYQAVARRYGQFAHASGQFASAGDAQTSTYICRANTTDATVTEIFLDGAGQRMTLPENATWTFDILVTGRTPGAASAGYQLRGVIENNAGTTALIGTVNKTILAEDTAAWDVTAVADDTNDALIIRVTGAAGANIRWVASVRTVEVSY